jgi:hypothetical protein
MKAGRMKNHGVHIMYALQPLSVVLYMRGCAMENLAVHFETSSRHEFSVPWHDSTSRLLCYKFQMFCTHSIHKSGLCTVCSFLSQAQVEQDYRLGPVPNPPRAG